MTGFMNPYCSHFLHCDHTCWAPTLEVNYLHPLPQQQNHSGLVRSVCLKYTSNVSVQCAQWLEPSEVNLYLGRSFRVRGGLAHDYEPVSELLLSRVILHTVRCVPLRSVFQLNNHWSQISVCSKQVHP